MENQPAETTTMEKIAVIQEALRALEIECHQAGLTYGFSIMAAKRQFILGTLERTKGNRCKAARALGMHRNTLTRTMQDLKIGKAEVRKPTSREQRRELRREQRRAV